MSEIDVYAVGFVRDFLFVVNSVRRTPKHTRAAWRKFRFGFKNGWKRGSYWNGFLAERTPGKGFRCGHGWTRLRALKDLHRHEAEVRRTYSSNKLDGLFGVD